MEYFANFPRNIVTITIIMFGWKMCSKFNFIAVFLILVNFAAFLNHTKENADIYLQMILTKSTSLRLLAHQIWSLYLTSQELGRGAFCPSFKIGLSNSPTTIGLNELK